METRRQDLNLSAWWKSASVRAGVTGCKIHRWEALELNLISLHLFIWWLTPSSWHQAVRKRCWMFSSCVSERATVQVPTGLHSQTVVTGWSNYWVVDTPAWRGFISSRKRDSQITVYPHRAPSLGLILQLQNGKATHRLWHCSVPCLHTHAHPHAQKLHRATAPNHNWCLFLFFFYSTCMRVLVCPHMPRPSPCFLSNTPTRTIKACGMTALCRCVCVWERATQRIGETDDTRVLFNLHPPLWIIIPP